MIRKDKKNCIVELAASRLKDNPFRTFLTVGSITLTWILFITVTSMLFGVMKVSQMKMMDYGGTDFHGVIYTEDERIQNHSLLQESCLAYELRESTWIGSDYYITLTATKEEFSPHLRGEFVGKWPVSDNEIVLSTTALQSLGIKIEIGQQITLNMNNEQYQFSLSGYFTPASKTQGNLHGCGFISEQWGEKEALRFEPICYLVFKQPFFIEKSIKEMLHDSNETFDYSINEAYLSTTIFEDKENIMVCLFMIVLFIFSGYLLIYNIFYISVLREVRFYGLLKIIGLTRKQIKRVLLVQGRILYLIAMPIGIIVGYVVSIFGLTPMFLSLVEADKVDVNYLPVILCSGIFTYLTLRISIEKPCTMADKLTMIEATKYQGVRQKKEPRQKVIFKNVLWDLAAQSFLKRKKVIGITTISIVLSMILFGIMVQITSGFDEVAYSKRKMPGDYLISVKLPVVNTNVITGESYLLEDYEEQESKERVKIIRGYEEQDYYLDDSLYDVVARLPGSSDIEKVISCEFNLLSETTLPAETTLEEPFEAEVIGVEARAMDFINLNADNALYGEFDLKKFQSGKYIILTMPSIAGNRSISSKYQIGDSVNIFHKDYEVMAVFPKMSNLNVLASNRYAEGSVKIFVPMKEVPGYADTHLIKVFFWNNREQGPKIDLHQLIDKWNVDITSKEEVMKEYSNIMSTIKLVGFSLCFILAFIGVLNLENTYVTNLLSRKREFSLLESIGMTKNQLKHILLYEGIMYFIVIGGAFSTVGIYIITFLSKIAIKAMNVSSYHFQYGMYFGMIATLVVVLWGMINLCYKTFFTATVADRIKELEIS